MRRIVVLMALAAILVCCMGTFAWAEGGDGGSGVIEPVSPEQFGSKLQGLGDMLYDATSPVADTIAKISLAIAGLLLIVLIVSGAAGLLRKVIGGAFAVALGLCLFYGAPHMVGLIKYISDWLMS
ncbi:MAG: hypothetical protein ACOX2E_03290 [Syntrophaceticus sp.]